MERQNPSPEADETPVFEVRLTPHRSLTPKGFAIISWIILMVGFVHGILFLVIGAWPVVGFAGLEWLLFWWLLRRHFKGDDRAECLRLFQDRLRLEQSDSKGRVSLVELQPYWLQVVLEQGPADSNALFLSSHGSRHEIGRFLSAEERSDLAETLRLELKRWRDR